MIEKESSIEADDLLEVLALRLLSKEELNSIVVRVSIVLFPALFVILLVINLLPGINEPGRVWYKFPTPSNVELELAGVGFGAS